jgi:hypothetical protein
LALGEANPVCDFAPVDPTAIVRELQAAFDTLLSDISNLPGANLLFPGIDQVKRLFDQTMNPLIHLTDQMEQIRQKHDTFLRATAGVANIVTLINALVNDAGYSRHDVAVEIYFLRKYGGLNLNGLSEAADIIAAKDPENAFSNILHMVPVRTCKI